MTTLTITISEERLAALKDKAASRGMTSEQLMARAVDEILASPAPTFEQALKRVLVEDKELHLRLAK